VAKLYQAEIPEDPDMLALLKPYQDAGGKQLLVDIGSSDGSFDEEHDYKNQLRPALAQLILRAMMEAAHADFAVINTGGIRDSLPGGRTTYKDVLKIHPFANMVSTVELSGREVAAYMDAVRKMSANSGAYGQWAGISVAPRDGPTAELRIAGKPVETGKTYRMVISSFLASGGDGYPKMVNHPRYSETGFTDAEVLRAYISAHSPLSAAKLPPSAQ
jgi:5'-nucleotidase/UDP-sugar diphosphatase